MKNLISYKDWHIPFSQDQFTLQQAYDDLQRVGAGQADIPFIVKLVENPSLTLPGLKIFHGAVELKQHDFIHIILGRGLLEMDEAFTIGFTMGSTKKVSTTEETLFTMIAKYLYPDEYKFREEAIEIFKNAVRLGSISACQPLDMVDFETYKDTPLKDIRKAIGLERNLILAYYEIEKERYPDSIASQRLLNV